MHDIRRLGLQVFAAPNNLTGEVQIEVKAREIDFVTSFGKNLKSLLDILGITRMIRKENNSVLKTKTVKGELEKDIIVHLDSNRNNNPGVPRNKQIHIQHL